MTLDRDAALDELGRSFVDAVVRQLMREIEESPIDENAALLARKNAAFSKGLERERDYHDSHAAR